MPFHPPSAQRKNGPGTDKELSAAGPFFCTPLELNQG